MALSPNINVMLRAAEKAARSLMRDFGEVEQLQVSKKGPGNFVSAADHRAEEIIYEELRHARPDYAFLMEESGTKGEKDAPYKWIVDPLDGTANFLHGLPHWNIAIALEHQDEVIAGIVYSPVTDEMFRAEKGSGAFMRNKRLRVSGRTKLVDSMILSGQPRPVAEERDLYKNEIRAFLDVCPNFRRLGAAALDICYVAAGRAEAFWEHKLSPWDIAAASIILKEAGGQIVDLEKRGRNPIYSGHVLATNANLHKEIYDLLQKTRQRQENAA